MSSRNEAEGLIRQNWPLLVTIGVLLGGAGFMATRGTNEKADAASVGTNRAAATLVSAVENQPQRKTVQDLAMETIAEHQAKIDADPDHEDTPAYWLAMGNLYKQKMLDYEKAAQCYERLLMDFPDWDNVRAVYMQLATCYERLEEKERAKGVYEKMLDVFPSDSQEHAIARAAVFR